MLAIKMQHYEILKFIGSYAAAMNGVDAIVFTAGIGENDPLLREKVMEGLTYLGVDLDYEKNSIPHIKDNTEITTAASKVKGYVIPTNEELVIARDTLALAIK